jgi:hypothetical protein
MADEPLEIDALALARWMRERACKRSPEGARPWEELGQESRARIGLIDARPLSCGSGARAGRVSG